MPASRPAPRWWPPLSPSPAPIDGPARRFCLNRARNATLPATGLGRGRRRATARPAAHTALVKLLNQWRRLLQGRLRGSVSPVCTNSSLLSRHKISHSHCRPGGAHGAGRPGCLCPNDFPRPHRQRPGRGRRRPQVQGAGGEGRETDLKQLLKKGPVVLYFYRRQWCPYCSKQLSQLQDSSQ